MKRMRRRSTSSSTLSLSVPATWLRKPSFWYCGMNSTPDFPAFSDAVTSAALLPIEETTPRPVTTTRFMGSGRRAGCRGVLGQTDLHVEGLIGRNAVRGDEAVGHAHHETAQDHALHMNVVGELLDGRHDHARQLHFTDAQSPAPALRPHPAEEETRYLPQGVEAQAPRHHRVTLEVAVEEPQVGLYVEIGHDLALAVFSAGFVDLGDAVEHQHRRQRQLRVARSEQVAFGALDQVFEGKAVLPVAHSLTVFGRPNGRLNIGEAEYEGPPRCANRSICPIRPFPPVLPD